ncbi:MAG: tetratricopeptide repeat protein [Desulfobacter sp.]|nr:MAG: tetratricopeptide repeat protein [Desulfobacter sp.]
MTGKRFLATPFEMNNPLTDKMNQLYAEALQALNSGDLQEALAFSREILAVSPNNVAAMNNVGLVFLKQKEYHSAVEIFEKAVIIDPGIAQLHHNLGLSLHKRNRLNPAAAAYQKALTLDPDYKESLQNLGAALKNLGRPEAAPEYYRRLLELSPDDANARFMLDSLMGTNQEKKAPDEYVADLFDEYADHFEDQLLKKLEYHTPMELKKAFVYFLGGVKQFRHLLDLGCGTGLVGDAFHGFAYRLTGVDLSEKMLEHARGKQLYNQLIKADFRSFLKQYMDRYDLVVAADVLVYTGILDDVFFLLGQRMEIGGYFVFSTEDNPNIHEFSLLKSGRYGHGPMYVQSVALKNNFMVRMCRPVRLRKEKGKWLGGNVFILECMGDK